MAETITRAQVIELIDTLPSETWPELAQFAEFLRFRARPRGLGHCLLQFRKG